ncbi:MAG: FtsW/RodA/SpoVE family cell cycle protein [Erysipelotrichaceae bacterium]|nr:FtsW/RodA/SpoVE family cell cycle protein [Erysipelotrichaceae bacterium]
MLFNLIQDVLLLLFLISAFQVVSQRHRDVYGFVVRKEEKVVLDGSQGLTTMIGRLRINDIHINKPDVPRKAAALTFDQKGHTMEVETLSKGGRYENNDYIIGGQRFHFSLPVNNQFRLSGMMPVFFTIGFIGFKAYCMYQEFPLTSMFIIHGILIAYVLLSMILRSDHAPIIESIFAIFLTYYIEATLYPALTNSEALAGCLRDSLIGVGVYVGMALIFSNFMKLDVNKAIGKKSLHQYLRIMALAGIIGLIVLNIVLAKVKYGAYNWITIGGMTFQPSEIVKLVYLLALVVPQRQLFNDRTNLIYTFGMTSIVFAYAVLIKDSGLLMQLGCLFIISVWLQNTDLLLIAIIILSTMVGAKAILKLSSTAAYRFTNWMGEGNTIFQILTGSGSLATHNGYGYQSVHALVAAFSNGGLLGNSSFDTLKGVMAANSDLVMGLLAQRHGAIFLFIMLLMVMLLIYTTFNSLQQQNRFQQVMTALSIAGIIFAIILNMGGTFSIIPLTGVVLPGISKGISAAICYGGMFGIICASGVSSSYYKLINERKAGMTNE